MKKMKILAIRFFMTLLFIGALFTTFQSISGVEAKTFITSIYEMVKGDSHRTYFTDIFKPTVVMGASVKNETPKLEEEIDWSQYPKKKVLATGYTAGYESTGKDTGHPEYGITYSGVMVKRDLYSTVAADLNVFPIGTILFIPGYGFGVVADKGGAIKGNRLDLYFHTVDDVYSQWGKKEVEVYVVKEGSGTLTEHELQLLNENETMQVFRQAYINTERK